MYSNPADISQAYRKDAIPYFSIVSGKMILERHEENDLDEGAEKLETALKKCGSGKVCVNIYKNIGKSGITDKTEVYKSYPFQNQYTLAEREDYYQRTGIAGAIIAEVRDVKSEIAAIKSKLEEEEIEDDEQLENKMEPNQNGFIGALLSNPAVQGMVTTLLTNLTANVMRPHPTRPINLAGMEPNETATAALATLFEKGMTIADLQKLAAMEPNQITFLLNMLRNQ